MVPQCGRPGPPVPDLWTLGSSMRVARTIIIAAIVCCCIRAHADTKLDFWHSYTHAQTHQKHYGFNLTNSRHGLFWGPCGPSTESIQWSYRFDLAGEGPIYNPTEVSVEEDVGLKQLKVVSGQIKTDLKSNMVTIQIDVEETGVTNKFVGNGTYAIHEIK
jgi:hypothetical protein